MPTTTPINYNNATCPMIQATYFQFFDIIRTHKAWNLHLEFENSMTIWYDEAQRNVRPPMVILKEYEKEKKKLMKELRGFKDICKQQGAVVDEVMYKDHFNPA
jgi:hypothetical protein